MRRRASLVTHVRLNTATPFVGLDVGLGISAPLRVAADLVPGRAPIHRDIQRSPEARDGGVGPDALTTAAGVGVRPPHVADAPNLRRNVAAYEGSSKNPDPEQREDRQQATDTSAARVH